MKYQIYLIILLSILSCKKERSIEIPEEITKITNGNLKSWLEKAPFEGLWNYTGDKNTMVITNIDQVFPFVGKFKNEDDNFKPKNFQNSDVYQSETVIFKDPVYGESFVYAALTYEPKELFLRNFYSEMGNVIMSGANAIHNSYRADLLETEIHQSNTNYKTTLYWVGSNNKSYLFGFYQQKNLVFEFGFPCNQNEKAKGLQKLKQLNTTLGLHVKEWTNATEEKLKITQNPKSFWKDPFYGLYRKSFIHQLKVKIKNTPFKELTSKHATEKNVDYIFSYEEKGTIYDITFTLEKTELNRLKYEESLANFEHKYDKTYLSRKLFITQEKTVGENTITHVEIYFKDYKILKITANYLTKNKNAKTQLFDILENLRVSDI